MQVIRAADWTDMPWRNGGGVTSELLAERQAGAILWRISSAIVDRDGTYSSFPGLNRISTVIEGAGTTLRDPESGAVVDIPPCTPTLLVGDIAWQGALTHGPIRHFNLIFDPQQVRASVEVLRFKDRALLPDESDAVFCVEGRCEIAGSQMKSHDMAVSPTGVIRGEATLLIIQIKRIQP